jgi:hypothetical protein
MNDGAAYVSLGTFTITANDGVQPFLSNNRVHDKGDFVFFHSKFRAPALVFFAYLRKKQE